MKNRWLWKTAALLGGGSLAALTGACSTVPGPSTYSYYAQYQRPAYAPPQNYAVNHQPVPRYNPATRRFEYGNMAMLGVAGAVGGVMAGRALSGGTAAEALTAGRTGAAVAGAAEAAEVGEAVAAGRAVGAARAGAAAIGAAEAVEGAEAEAVIEWIIERWWLLELL